MNPKMFMSVALMSAVSTSIWGATKYCTVNDPDMVYDWSTPSIWTDETAPVANDSVQTVQNGAFTTLLKVSAKDVANSTDLGSVVIGHDTFWAGGTAITTVVEVVSGGILTTKGLSVGTGQNTASVPYSKLIVSGGAVTNLSGRFVVGNNRCPNHFLMTAGSFCQMNATSGNTFVGGRGTPAGKLTFQVDGGVFDTAGTMVFNSDAQFSMNGGVFLGSASFYGPSKLNGGRFDKRNGGGNTTLEIKNSCSEVTSSDGFELNGGALSNCNITVNGGLLKMTGGLHYGGDPGFKISPAAGMKSFFVHKGGRLLHSRYNVDALSGPCEIFQSGGEVDLYCGMSFGGANSIRYVITNGTFRSVDGSWEASIRTSSTAKDASFVVRGTPSVTIHHLGGSVGARPWMAYEIDGRGLSPIAISNTADFDAAGWMTLRPYGGFQMVTNSSFALFSHSKTVTCTQTDACVPNANLWQTGALDEDGHTWGSTLKESARLSVARNEAYANADGVPYGWFPLPRISSATLGAKVTIGLKAKGVNTLDDLAAQMQQGGYEVKMIERASEQEGKVEVTLPLDRARAKGGEARNVLFDFTSYSKASDVYEGNVTTNAVVVSVSLDIKGPGLAIILR